jgi:hypothetical protein
MYEERFEKQNTSSFNDIAKRFDFKGSNIADHAR